MAGQPKKRARKPNPNPSRPPKGKPAYTDAALVGRICARIAIGVSYGTASIGEGLSRDAVQVWLHRAKEYGDKADAALQAAVSAIMRARSIAEGAVETAIWDGSAKPSQMFFAERQLRSDYGNQQTIQIEGPTPDSQVGSLLGKLLGLADPARP